MAALSGLTVTCFATGGSTPVGQVQHLPSKTWWQETPASGVSTTSFAPSEANEYGPNIFRMYSAVAAWVSIGPVPAAATSPRFYLPAESERDYIVAPGDKLQWIADA